MTCPHCNAPYAPFVTAVVTPVPYTGVVCADCREIGICEYGVVRTMSEAEIADPRWAVLIAHARLTQVVENRQRMARAAYTN
jgi:hypothetical protein